MKWWEFTLTDTKIYKKIIECKIAPHTTSKDKWSFDSVL